MTRQDFQTLVTKLDLNHITLKEAKIFASRLGIASIKGRNKEQFIKNLSKFV